MKYISKIAFFIVLISFLESCGDSDTPPICLKDICIEGEWNWIQSSGSIAGVTITPQTEMLTRKITIDELHYSEYVDDELVLQKEYEYLITDELQTFTSDSLVLKLDEGNWYAIFKDGENLILSEPCADCWEHSYDRD